MKGNNNTMNTYLKKFLDLRKKYNAKVHELVEPARAAAIQMKDAGMAEGSLRLLSILHDIHVLDDEGLNYLNTIPEDKRDEVIVEILEMMVK